MGVRTIEIINNWTDYANLIVKKGWLIAKRDK